MALSEALGSVRIGISEPKISRKNLQRHSIVTVWELGALLISNRRTNLLVRDGRGGQLELHSRKMPSAESVFSIEKGIIYG